MFMTILTHGLAFVAGGVVGIILMCILVAGGRDDERWGN